MRQRVASATAIIFRAAFHPVHSCPFPRYLPQSAGPCIFPPSSGGAILSVAALAGIALILAYPQLPSLEVLTDYQPKIPLRIYSSDGHLIGEFGEERRDFARIKDTLR